MVRQPTLSLRSSLLLVIGCFSTLNGSEAILVANKINLPSCYNHLDYANNNYGGTNPSYVDKEEFRGFLQRIDNTTGTTPILQGPTTYDELPVYAKDTFDLLNTVCFDNPLERSDACKHDAGLNMPNPPRTFITENHELYLFNLCFSAYDVISYIANSAAPTETPTSAPTDTPTTTPTSTPTASPTSTPSSSPTTSSPTASPTNAPTAFPTPAPSSAPQEPGSETISDPPSSSPTAAPTDVETISTEFSINAAFIGAGFLDSGSDESNSEYLFDPTSLTVDQQSNFTTYLSVLQIGMSDLSLFLSGDSTRGRRLGRQLGVRAQDIFAFEEAYVIQCPEETDSLADPLCLRLEMTTNLQVYGDDLGAINDAIEAFLDDFEGYVEDDALQNYIDSLSLSDQQGGGDLVFILKELTNSAGIRDIGGESGDDGGSLSASVTAGVVSAAMLFVLVPFALLFFHRQRDRGDDEKAKVFYEPYDPDDNAPSEIEPDADSMDADMLVDQRGSRGIQTLGAARANYGVTNASKKVLEAMEAGEDIVAEPEFDAVERDSASSNAGSSGWSSSAGISSYNTGSMDDSMDAAYAAGTTLAAIGGVSALSRHMNRGRRRDDLDTSGVSGIGPASGGVSRDQLDSFIEAGDWAAVGATAALLAAASDSQSNSTTPSKRSRSSTGTDSLEAARAAELDHLVDAGDWEGVVLAAARFEAAETTVCSRGSRTASSVESGGSGTASRTIGSATGTSGSPSEASESQSMSRSDDPSRARQRREVRAEVEALVRRVVPEEIDNVDEMMNQFKGREEELVETLRTMQERAIAQKARTATQKTAKMEARKNVKRGVVPGLPPPAPVRSSQQPPLPPPPSRTSRPRSQAQSVSSQSGTNSDSADSNTIESLKQTKSDLERAINSGNWEEVGRAAAFMSDNSVTNGQSAVAASNMSTNSGSTRTRNTKDSETSIRQQELDEMIGRGDWEGVMAAADRFSQMDKKVKSEVGRSREEEDALEQAKMWANIANQTRATGSANDAGASDAAEWAIQRSLTQMNRKDSSPKDESGEDEV